MKTQFVSRLVEEIKSLKTNGYLIFEENIYQCFVIPGKILENTLLLEIGKIRENVLRQSLHGSGNDYDLDGLDRFYYHVVLWDKQKSTIVGGYRFRTNENWEAETIKEQSYIEKCYPGIYFYFSKQYRFVELGRSFINECYQKDTFSLFYLWRGVLLYLTKYYKDFSIIVGVPWVKIDDLKPETISFLIHTLSNDYFYKPIYDVNPAYPYRNSSILKSELLDLAQKQQSMTSLFHVIKSLENKKCALPVLLKQYINLMQAKVHAFSVAPEFNNLLEILMSTDLSVIPEQRLKRYVR